MSELDDHIAAQSTNPEWEAEYKHALRHYQHWDFPDDCPGGDACTLPSEPEEENTEG